MSATPKEVEALRKEFSDWCDMMMTGALFSPGAKSSDFYFSIWLGGRDSALRTLSAVPPQPLAVPRDEIEGLIADYCHPNLSMGRWADRAFDTLKRIATAPQGADDDDFQLDVTYPCPACGQNGWHACPGTRAPAPAGDAELCKRLRVDCTDITGYECTEWRREAAARIEALGTQVQERDEAIQMLSVRISEHITRNEAAKSAVAAAEKIAAERGELLRQTASWVRAFTGDPMAVAITQRIDAAIAEERKT